MGEEHRYRQIFAPDSGALLDIYIFEVTASHWQSLLNFLAANYVLSYSEDGAATALPDFETIWQRRQEKAVTLEILLLGFTINSHFFLTEEIKLDLLPEDVNSAGKAESVFALMRGVAGLLEKEVFLIPEHGSANELELKRMAVCSCDPTTGAIILR